MSIDWKRKLTSRKFWVAIAGFVSLLLVALGKDASEARIITGLIMAGADVAAYIIGEGLADKGSNVTVNGTDLSDYTKTVEEE